MTTVLFSKKHNKVVCDSRFCIRGDIVTDKGIKIKKANGVTFVMAGSTQGLDALIAIYFERRVTDFEMAHTDAMAIDNGKVYLVSVADDNYAISEAIDNMGIGTGSIWALAALDFGLTPEKAVKYAMKKDVYTGGTIRTINVK